MGDSRKVFSIYPRKRKKQKPVYYVRFRMHDDSWTPGKNSGETSRSAAERWAIAYLMSGQVVEKEMITFAGFCRNFFSWDGDWATDRKLSAGRVSERVCIENQSTVDTRITPFLGKKKLTEIDRSAVKDYRRDLFKKGYAPRTINKTLSCLKMILEYAEEKKLIQGTPKIERAASVGKNRGVLTIEEVRKLFSEGVFPDFRSRVANMTAAVTGLRAGELLALQRENVKTGYLEVKKSWNQRLRKLNDTTKNGRERMIPIPKVIERELTDIMDCAPWQDPKDFVFFSTVRTAPMDGKVGTQGLYKALESIEIDEDERKARWIDFHSWRHWLNSTLINQKVPLNKVMAITGHLTVEMTRNYYHVDDLSDVRQIQEGLL